MDDLMIQNFLDVNYYVMQDDISFTVVDKINGNKLTPNRLSKTFKTIFGDVNCDDGEHTIKKLQCWFDKNKNDLIIDLIKFFDKLKLDKGSAFLLPTLQAEVKLIFDGKYSEKFIENNFLDYYLTKYLVPELENYVNDYDDISINSVALSKEFEAKFNLEHFKIQEFGIKYLNQWYFDKKINDKLIDFLSQLVITLGTKNWLVTWIGHGPLSQKKMLDYFGDESEVIKKIITTRYEEWYSEAVIESSEKMLRNNSYNNTLPTLNHPNHEI